MDKRFKILMLYILVGISNLQGAEAKTIARDRTPLRQRELNDSLIEAINRVDIEAIRELIEAGVEINAPAPDGYIPLIEAVIRGHVSTVDFLLKKGAEIDVRDTLNHTPLIYAARLNQKSTTALLLDKGADVNAQDHYGNTALIWAAIEGHVDIAKLLLQNEANPNLQNNEGSTALMEAAARGRVDIVKLLLDNGADVNAQDHGGNTALIEAAIGEEVEIASLLLQNGADVTVRNSQGRTALDWSNIPSLALLIKNTQNITIEEITEFFEQIDESSDIVIKIILRKLYSGEHPLNPYDINGSLNANIDTLCNIKIENNLISEEQLGRVQRIIQEIEGEYGDTKPAIPAAQVPQ